MNLNKFLVQVRKSSPPIEFKNFLNAAFLTYVRISCGNLNCSC